MKCLPALIGIGVLYAKDSKKLLNMLVLSVGYLGIATASPLAKTEV